jgi:predicted nucleic acid-binding protein
MSVFVDTSALVKLLDANEEDHDQAATIWASLAAQRESLVTTNYVVAETIAVIQRRLGVKAVHVLKQQIMPVMRVEWVNETDHDAGFDAVIAAGRNDLSLVDCISFAIMRRLAIRRCFTFDAHFQKMGFEPLR